MVLKRLMKSDTMIPIMAALVTSFIFNLMMMVTIAIKVMTKMRERLEAILTDN